ncbi:SMI1/KNR4 family protein [Nocardia altamirensis]|uniref:SMI1/KNR4 family protein n=1 Tax=Nocardia altamirensis TaxID=472158 RepID=UPI00083FFB2D|nr:SMI1/KNR4 family protein [Nocardia altamirensis]
MVSFWGGSDYGVLAPLTDTAVQDAEAQLGVRLPASLVRLLRIQNGGTVADRWNHRRRGRLVNRTGSLRPLHQSASAGAGSTISCTATAESRMIT